MTSLEVINIIKPSSILLKTMSSQDTVIILSGVKKPLIALKY